MSVYFVTNRPVNSKGVVNPDPNVAASHEFRVGSVDIKESKIKIFDDLDDVSIKASVEKDVEISKLKGSARMLAELYKKLSQSQGRQDVLVVVHGFSYNLDDELKHLKRIHHDYVENTSSPVEHLVYVSWPSSGNKSLYYDDQDDAWQTGEIIARLFKRLKDFVYKALIENRQNGCHQRIHLLAHSMGNQVLASMFQRIKGFKLPFFAEVILCNSDVRNTVFEKGEPFDILDHFCERIHIYIHRSDDVLRASQLGKNFNMRLGLRGPKRLSDLPKEKAFVIDTTAVPSENDTELRELMLDHWGYLNRKGIKNDIRAVFQGEDETIFEKRDLKVGTENYYFIKNK